MTVIGKVTVNPLVKTGMLPDCPGMQMLPFYKHQARAISSVKLQ